MKPESAACDVDCRREGLALFVEHARSECFDGVSVDDRDSALHDYRASIICVVAYMYGAAGLSVFGVENSAVYAVTIHALATVCRQKRWMDVEDASVGEIVWDRQESEVAGKADDIDPVLS